MLKYAFDYGVKLAFGEEGLTSDQLGAAQQLWGIGGGLAGAGAGAAGGRAIARHLADTYGWDEDKAKEIGLLLGGVGGGALGGYAGSLIPKLRYNRVPEATNTTNDVLENYGSPVDQSALGVMPMADYFNYGY